MNQKIYFVVLCIFAGLFPIRNSQAQRMILLPSQDVFIDEQLPATNFNGQPLHLSIQHFGTTTYHTNILLKFDVEAGFSWITNAVLRLHPETPAGGTAFDSLEIWKITDAWSANSLTWDGMSSLGKELLATIPGPSGSLDLPLPPALIEFWSANPASNHGLMIRVNASDPYQSAYYTDYEHLTTACSELEFDGGFTSPVINPVLLGPDTVCSVLAATFTAYPNNPYYAYYWTVPGNWIGFSGITNTYMMSSAGISGNICVQVSSQGGSTFPVCKNVFVVSPNPWPGIVTGPPQVCSGDTAVYTLIPAIGSPYYDWEIPSDWLIISGFGSTQITVVVGTEIGYVSVALPPNYCPLTNMGYMIPYIFPEPGPAILTGPVTVLPNTVATYSASSTTTSYYSWTVPAGSIILTDSNAASIDVLIGNQAGNLCVRGVNYCSSGMEACMAIGLTGLDETVGHSGIQIIREPGSARQFTFRNTGNQRTGLRLLNGNGSEILLPAALDSGDEIRISLPSSGLFLLEVRTAEGISMHKLAGF